MTKTTGNKELTQQAGLPTPEIPSPVNDTGEVTKPRLYRELAQGHVVQVFDVDA
jgi:hypothetical protein